MLQPFLLFGVLFGEGSALSSPVRSGNLVLAEVEADGIIRTRRAVITEVEADGSIRSPAPLASLHESNASSLISSGITLQLLRAGCRQAMPPLLHGTMKSLNKLISVFDSLDHIVDHSVPGDIVEAGVAEGGGVLPVIFYLACTGSIRDRKVHLFDTWEGLPPPTSKEDEGFSKGEFHEALEVFNANAAWFKNTYNGFAAKVGSVATIREWEEAWANVNLIKGFFADTMSPTLENRTISLLMCDGDMYASTKDCLESAAGHISKGGVIYNDDYYSFKGCFHAVDEYMKNAPFTGKMYVVPQEGPVRYMQENEHSCIPPVTNSGGKSGHCDGLLSEASVFYVD